MVKLGEVGPAIWEVIMEEMEEKLKDIEFKGNDILPDWRKLAHKQKLNREIFEKYGHWKDIILHPKFQMVKHYMEEHADFNMVVGEPLLPWPTAIILLFMLNKRISTHALSLVAVFLFNFNPFYVGLAVIFLFLTTKTSHRPKQYIAKSVPKVKKSLKECQPKDIKQVHDLESTYDHVLIGGDLATLYSAALLAKAGHRCCVLQPKLCTPVEINPPDAPCSTPIVQCAVGRVDRYQVLLDAAQSSSSSSSAEERVTLHPIGSKYDAYTNAVIAVREVPASSSKITLQKSHASANTIRTLCTRTGEQSLAYDLCSFLTIEKSSLVSCFAKIGESFQHLTAFFLSKIVSRQDWISSGVANKDQTKSISDLLRTSVEQILSQHGFESNRIIESMAALSCTVGLEEALLASDLSGVSLANVIANAESGRYVPIGGVGKVVASLTRSIEQAQGIVIKNVDIRRMDIEELTTTANKSTYKARGVTIGAPQTSTSEGDAESEFSINATKSVVSGLGLLSTYTTLLPSECISSETRAQLDTLQEARPKLKVAVWLRGSSEDLGLTSTDYYEIGNPVPVAVRNSQVEEGKIAAEQLAMSYIHVWSPSVQDPTWTESHPSNIQVLIVEFEVTEPLVYLETDRTFSNHNTDDNQSQDLFDHGPKFYCTTRESESNPNHSNFASKIGRPLNISTSKQKEYLQKAEAIVHTLYPKTSQKVEFKQLLLPMLGGHKIANNVAKYQCTLSATTEVQNFFVTGCDLSTAGFMGDLQSGWITANAVLGYNMKDLQANRNIIADLQTVSQ